MTTPFLLKNIPNIIIFLHAYSIYFLSIFTQWSSYVYTYPSLPCGLILYLISSISPSGLPTGFIPNDEILNAERPNLPPPPTIYYVEKHVRPYFISLIALIVLIEPVFKHGQLQVE